MSRTEALVLAGHGSQHHPDSSAPLYAHARTIRERACFAEVLTAFWREEPAVSDVPWLVDADVAFVVPVLTSEGYFADEVFPRELRLDERGGHPSDVEVRYADPVGTHDGMASVVADRVDGTIQGDPGDVGVAVVGHGTERNPQSAMATRRHADRLRERDRYAAVAALFLEEAPAVGSLLDVVSAPEVVVVPLFVADGHHTTRDIPAALGHPGVGESARIQGRLVHLTGAVGTEPRVADLAVERAVEAGATAGERTIRSNGVLTDAERDFVATVEAREDGRPWGELVARGTGDRYALRHERDADVDAGGLATLAGPGALRRLARRDDRGRYRPLTGARSLPAGWTLEGLDAAGLVRAVRAVYPGSIVLWHRERAGGLDPTPFAETAARQSGIYAGLGAVEESTLAAAVEAVCGDCVRDRRWTTPAETGPADGPAEGDVPCREACPFLRAAATALPAADASTAAAEDPSVPLAAFDSGGNRYRVRFNRPRPDGAAAVQGTGVGGEP